MFTECSKLPHFDSSKIDKTYAYPDDGASGYFTPKEPEAYVALTNNGTELEFHYDKNKSKYDTTYYLNTGKDKPAWSMSGITTVTFAEEFASYRPTSCYN